VAMARRSHVPAVWSRNRPLFWCREGQRGGAGNVAASAWSRDRARFTPTRPQSRFRTGPTTPIPRHSRGALSRVARPRNKSPRNSGGFFLRGEDFRAYVVPGLIEVARRESSFASVAPLQILPARVRAPYARFAYRSD
jgi:hypothetical protein